MGYKIQYEIGESEKIYISTRQADRKKRITIVLVCILVLSMLLSPLRNRILRYLIPGDPEVTTRAFSQMLRDLEKGDSLKTAVSVFCETVIQNG